MSRSARAMPAHSDQHVKKLAVMLTAFTVLAACGEARGLSSAGAPSRFELEGKVVKASRSKPAEELSKAGSITLQLSASDESSRSCSLEPPRVVVIPFTAETSFEPVELTAAADFPASLDGLNLSVRGNFQAERNCSPVATSVKSLSLGSEIAETIPDPEGRPSTDEAVPSSSASSKGPPPPKLPPPAPPAPPALSSLPELAPAVSTSFRPSLPDPPPR